MADAGVKAVPEPVAGDATAPVELIAGDLAGPGVVFCPNPRMPLWSGHPRVFIDVATTGQGRCPYCGTVYRLPPGVHAGGH